MEVKEIQLETFNKLRECINNYTCSLILSPIPIFLIGSENEAIVHVTCDSLKVSLCFCCLLSRKAKWLRQSAQCRDWK